MRRVRRDRDAGKATTTQAGEFVREEMKRLEEGRGRAQSRKQAVAIGLSEARRAGVDLPPPKKGRTSDKTRKSAESAYRRGQESGALTERRGSRAAPSQAVARSTSRHKPASSSRAGSRGRSAGKSRSRKRSR
jgi:hypothetical protein